MADEMPDFDDFEQWVKWGYDQGWIGAPVCLPHDGIPTTEAEDEDPDLCLHIVRLYEDDIQRREVEDNHSPTTWRASNRGWGRDNA